VSKLFFLRRELQLLDAPMRLTELETRLKHWAVCLGEIEERLKLPHDPERNNHALLEKAYGSLRHKQQLLQNAIFQRKLVGRAAVVQIHADRATEFRARLNTKKFEEATRAA
jgi:hypothetical protein